MAKKRSHGEGSVWKLKNGSWRGQIMDGYTSEGKKKIVNFSGESRGEVLEQIRDYNNKVDANVHVDRKQDLGSWAELWYRDYQSQVQASTYSGYRYTLKIIKDRMGEQILCDVLPIDINRFLDALVEQGYSLSQIRKCRTMLIQIFDAADNNGLVSKNPARKAKIIRDKGGVLLQQNARKDAFTEEEVEILKEELGYDLLGNSILLMIGSGMRVQELLALTAEDIAEDGSSIRINKAIKMVDGHPVLGSPKSVAGNRTIPIPESFRKYAVYLRGHGGKKYIWSLPGCNEYYGVGSFRRRYYTALKQIDGVRRLSPHCCRHTYVSRLEARGVPMEQIARLVGHTKIATTDIYLHLHTDVLQAAVDVLNKKGGAA